VGRDAPHAAGPDVPLLVLDAEPDGALDDDPDLLVVVVVLGENRPRGGLDDGNGQALALDDPREPSFGDQLRGIALSSSKGAIRRQYGVRLRAAT